MTDSKFEMDSCCHLPRAFTGFSLREEGDTIIQDRHDYLRKLENLPKNVTCTLFRSMRVCLAWLANTSPDCLFEISQIAKVTETHFNAEHNA